MLPISRYVIYPPRLATSQERAIISLRKWVSGGEVDRAKERILEVIKKQESELNLYKLNLTTLPVVLWELTNLTKLILDYNKLTTLPTEIGLLSNLTSLHLWGNGITSLPTEIGQLTELCMSCSNLASFPMEILKLTRLTRLMLYSNRIASLPTEIGRLTNLTELDLSTNKLSSLPKEIGLLTNLTRLHVNWNELTSLPIEIGQLMSLTMLELTKNDSLRELPLCLGQIPGLTCLFTENTRVDRNVRESILDQCRRGRDTEAVHILPKRLDTWFTIAANRAELQIDLSDEQKKTLNEWLLRLEKTRDFAHLQSTLAKTVCSIVEDVLKHKEFQELFFSQAEANNGCCEDRAAMSLNEIYTSWKILCQSVPLKEMTGVAKTLCLRKELQKLIPKEERESVEIFLYYESTLRERLQLVTAIQHMAYETIGRRDWIDENSLVNKVEANFFDELFEMPVFQKMVPTEDIDLEFHEKLGECPEGCPDDNQVLEYQHRQGVIMQEWKRKKMAVAKERYEHHR